MRRREKAVTDDQHLIGRHGSAVAAAGDASRATVAACARATDSNCRPACAIGATRTAARDGARTTDSLLAAMGARHHCAIRVDHARDLADPWRWRFDVI